MSPKENSSLTFRLPYWSVGLILMVIIDGVSFARDRFQVMGNTLHDYDTLTRLAFLRGALESHSLNHGFFDRLNAPYGMVLHWTLPFNLYVILLVKLFGLINPATAVQYAGYWAGTILRAFVGPVAYWAGRAILTPGAAAIASLLVLFNPYLMAYAHHGSANHHALMYLESVIMLGLSFQLVTRPSSNLKLPLVAGAIAGLCLWTTFELVIVAGPLFVVLTYLWIEQGATRLRQMVLASASFAITMTAALLIDPPYGGFAMPVLDHISMALQSIACVPFLIALGAVLFKPQTEVRRAGLVLAFGLVTGGIWLACYPFAIHGVQGAMDPYVAREWLTQIEEVLPVENWRRALFFLGPTLIALVLVFVWRGPRSQKESMLMSILILYIMGQLHFRFVLYSAVAVPYFIAYVYERSRRDNGEFPSRYNAFAKPVALGLVGLFIVTQIAITVVHYDVINPPVKNDVPDGITCNPNTVKAPLNDAAWMGLGKKDPLILSEVNQSADLLYWTQARMVAGNYHRDSQGIKDDYMFFRDMGSETAKEIVKKRGVDFVLLCGNGNNAALSFESIQLAAKELAKPGDEFEPQETMYTRLSDQQPPPWLKLRTWPDDVDTDLVLYQVDKKMLGK